MKTELNLARLLLVKFSGGGEQAWQSDHAPLYLCSRNSTLGTFPKKGARPYLVPRKAIFRAICGASRCVDGPELARDLRGTWQGMWAIGPMSTDLNSFMTAQGRCLAAREFREIWRNVRKSSKSGCSRSVLSGIFNSHIP